ncbi:MAG: hypothetical protein H7Y88_01735 [Phycisphaerales bacterium]|nr:hypothetical protein [Phycisphaerales bacterium]
MPNRAASHSPARLALTSASLLLAFAAGGGAALGQETPAETAPAAPTQPEGPSNAQILRDFIHYILINRADLAAQWGKALLDKNISPTDFATLVESSNELARFEETITRVQRSPQAGELEDIASRMLKLYEQGKLDTARNPDQISKAIALLTGPARNRLVGIDRIRAAGEYAMPQLLQALLARRDAVLQAEVRRVMVDLGRHAVIPLATALPGLDEAGQEIVIGVLGEIGYGSALPFLVDSREHSKSESVRTAADRAIDRIGGASAGASVSALYRDLAEGYYDQSASLTNFPGEDDQLLWVYDPGVGLIPSGISTTVFHEAMAMRLSERALVLDAADGEALALWLASNFSREIDTLKDYENPAYGADRREAMYYAVASGAGPSQRVLARAIDDRDTPLARRAIAAIEQTAGGDSLWAAQNAPGSGGERRPLLEGLRYPNRRVQYESALAIGAAQPREAFEGSDRVVPTLASAVRSAAAKFALVISSDEERHNTLAATLAQAGFTVLSPARSLSQAENTIAEAPGIDLIVADLSDQASARTDEFLSDARGSIKLGASPIIALVTLDAQNDLAPRHGRDASTMLARASITAEQLAAAVDQLTEVASGGVVTEQEATSYKERALAVLRDLAISGNPALSVADAAAPLVAALSDNRGELKLAIADVLAHIDQKRAQVAIMDSALGTGAADAPPDRAPLLGKVAQSAKRFGNLLEDRQIDRLRDIATKGEGEEATAAAALMGALSLPNSDVIPLIIGENAASK